TRDTTVSRKLLSADDRAARDARDERGRPIDREAVRISNAADSKTRQAITEELIGKQGTQGFRLSESSLGNQATTQKSMNKHERRTNTSRHPRVGDTG